MVNNFRETGILFDGLVVITFSAALNRSGRGCRRLFTGAARVGSTALNGRV